MYFFKGVRKLSIVVSSVFVAACQQLAATPETTGLRAGLPLEIWQSEEPQLFTDYSSGHLCRATAAAIDSEPPQATAYTLWQRVRAGYGMDWKRDEPRVEAELNRFKNNPRYLSDASRQAERYLHYVVDALAERDMPMELALLPFIESAYDPFAYSHGRAAGMWQFIPGTATHFGLKQNWWYDGRRDVVASTEAALDYLESLHRLFDGDWFLALAAYNSGQGTVGRAIRRNVEAGEPTDYWSLDLPRETQAYVPRLLALAHLIRTPRRYGLELYPVPNDPYFAAVDTMGQIDLARVARLAEIDMEELYLLNPGFNRWATDPEGPHSLLVPAAQAESLRARLAALPVKERLRWQRYKVRSGDSLITIARSNNIDVNSLREANQLTSNLIRAGDMLMIPSASRPAAEYVLSAGQRLSSVQSRSPRGSAATQRHHTVISGDSFWSISRKHGVSVRQLAKWNGMAPGDTLRPGQTLSIWTEPATAPAAASNGGAGGPPAEVVVRKVNYQVRSGDSLARIAHRFRVGIDDIVQWNTLNPASYLQPGQRLTLHVDVTRGFN